MGELSLEYRQTRARASFKRRTGHVTQHLLTLIVGVDAVRNGARANETLPATWNPRDHVEAANRARAFALNAALLWSTEAVISYVRDLASTRPRTISESLITDIQNTKDKERKLVLLCTRLKVSEPDALALVRVAYVWRNKVTHYASTNRIDATVSSHLNANCERIRADYQGLDVQEMMVRIQKDGSPRLKEVASFVRAASRLTREIDQRVVQEFGALRYLRACLVDHLKSEGLSSAAQKAAGLWGGTEAQNRRSLENFGMQMSLSRSDGAPLDDEGLASLSPSGAVHALIPNFVS